MASVQRQIEDLRQRVTKLDKSVVALSAEIAEIRNDLGDFEARYEALIRPVADHLAAVQAAIQSLEALRSSQKMGNPETLESLWRQQHEPATETNSEDPDPALSSAPKPRKVKAEKLKKLYRRLARRYHPDMAKTDLEREQYTKIMALINTAYGENDYETLVSLSDATDTATQTRTDHQQSQVPLEVLQLRRVKQQYFDLQAQVQALKGERDELLYGDLMQLKIQESFARVDGRDFLQELADEMTADYHAEMQRLDELRRETTNHEN